MKTNSFIGLALSAFALTPFASCHNDDKDEPLHYLPEIEKFSTDNNLTLVKVVNTGLCYNNSELTDIFRDGVKMEKAGDTLNVYVAAHANQVTDSLHVEFFTNEDKLLLMASPYFDPQCYYADALCILTRKLQFLAKVEKDYKLVSRDEYIR